MKYKYELVRSARRSISVSVSAENKITVRCPWGMSLAEIEKFLASKESWIEKVALENSKKLAWNDDVIEFRQIYVDGAKLPLAFSDKNEIKDGTVHIKRKEDIEQLYKKLFFAKFCDRVKQFEERTKLYSNSVSVKDYKGRWGCCDAKNNLIFNYKLFMLPANLQDYVILHELCHTLCHNHSAAFWRLVEEYMPDYKICKKQMKSYDFLTTLY